MLVAGSDCSRALGEMAKDENVMGEVEEGEISDSTSLEEISEEDFNKQDAKTSNSNSEETKQMVGASGGSDNGVAGGKGGNNTNPRVWTMRDLLSKYPACRGYAASGLYNLAWAQAVQNKPLNEVLVMDVESNESSKGSSESSKSNEDDKIVIEDSGDAKEEGELEEGEIDLESEPVDNLAGETQSEADSGALLGDTMNAHSVETDTKEKDLENKVKSIRGVLESTSSVEAHKSFEGVCSRLLSALESLRQLVLENDNVPKKDILVQLSFAALQTINSVFCSMNYTSKEINKETVSSLLSLVKSHFSPFLFPNQLKEIEIMIQSLNFSAVAPSARANHKDEVRHIVDGIAQKDYDTLAANIDHGSIYINKFGDSLANSKLNLFSEASKRGASSVRNRMPLLPLLDLHKDHDLDSLPSPTRETAPSLPVNRPLTVGQGLAKPEFAFSKTGQGREDAKIHPYENDALKAVSTYQQKFGRNSFFRTDSLPSPTPSEESDDGNGDIGGEVSSSSVASNSKPLNIQNSGKPIISPSNLNFTTLLGRIVPHSSVSTPAVPQSSVSNLTAKSSAKSRDPRLRFANSESTALDANQHLLNNVHNNPKLESSGAFLRSRKQKGVDEPFIDGPALKRPKNGLGDHSGIKDVQKTSGSGGWLESTDAFEPLSQLIPKAETDPRKTENGVTQSTTATVTPCANVTTCDPASLTAAAGSVSLPSLLKDIAVNPTMLINLLKMGEKPRATESTHQKPTDPRKAAQLPGSNSVSQVSVPPSSTSAILPKPVGTLQVPSQALPSDESGKIRMKPRDPRRVLHGNTLQRTGSLVEEHFKVNQPFTSGNQGIKDKIEGQAEAKELPSQLVQPHDVVSGKPPDIAPQFTKSLQNIANLITVSQVSNTPIVSQNLAPQSIQLKVDRDAKRVASNSGDHQSGAGSAPGLDALAPARPQNSWGDVEHLLEGYDDKQKAAIQRERARRLEEQKKMFAASKLCLVLDLDHTLLNSAKFNEVDPIHDEILRRKEEQDREKQYRHLFRFPHMGMWTKLRPGIWNFLEKASKLYELHLYTMGNKLYATEMAKVLDPKGTLFNGRVISRGDDGDPFDGDERVPKSKDLEGVLGMESAVVIIDDSVRVWPHNKMNLIVVERYTYFPCSRRQFGLLGPSLLEIDHDERPEDGTLASSLAVIERIHEIFFSHPSLDEVDVRNILASEQRKILAGCRIVFSRVFPVGEANPHLHPLWQTAEQFGAVCTTQLDEHVTHVVANSLGTDKVNWALSRGRFVVHPGWVEASALLYRRANEHDFAIKP